MTTTDTLADLHDAIDRIGLLRIERHIGCADEDAEQRARADLDRAITAHVAAEVARALACAPEVEHQISILRRAVYDSAITGVSVGGVRETIDRLRAAIAADKARAVEAAEDAAFIRGRDAVRKYPDGWGLVARPAPDEARRLVEAHHLDLLSIADTVASLHGATGPGLRGHCVAQADRLRLAASTARTALLRALGVEA